MIIAFFVNSMADEHPHYTTTILANECVRRGHSVLYLTPGDFLITADNRLLIHGRFPPAGSIGPSRTSSSPSRTTARSAPSTSRRSTS